MVRDFSTKIFEIVYNLIHLSMWKTLRAVSLIFQRLSQIGASVNKIYPQIFAPAFCSIS